MEIKAKAELALAPKGNQIAVNIMLVISAVFFGVAVWLDATDKNCVLAVVVAVSFLLLGGGFWWKSHKNESLQEAHPFTLKVGEGDSSVSVSADARSLPALDYLKGILGQYSAVFHREPLPEPSGKVGAGGRPIDGTAEEARTAVQSSNSIAQIQSNEVAEEICAKISLLTAESPVLGDVSATIPGEP